MNAAPGKEHQWLQRLVGEWASEAEATMEPGKPPETFKGTESVRSLGGLWILAEGQGQMPGGGTATTLMTLGHDPQKRRYVGTFIGSMMTSLRSDDHRVLTSHVRDDDGTWRQFMTARYRRRT